MFAPYDVLIKNAIIVDGTGKPAYLGSIGIQGDKIAAVGDVQGEAATVIDGAGLIVSPGFIDPHSHADTTICLFPQAENLVMQGITTFVGGNCGMCPAPIANDAQAEALAQRLGGRIRVDWRTHAEWLAQVEETGISLNYAPLAGHESIRSAVMGEDFKRTATQDEIEAMGRHVDEAMRAGMHGLSCFYDPGPGEYANMDEMVALAKIAARYGGTFYPHTRHIQSQWPSDDPQEHGYGIYHGPLEDIMVGRYRGYLEAIEVGRQAGLPVHIAHLSPAFIIPQPHPEYLDEAAARATLEIIDRAREEGVDVTFDTIPCTSSIAGQGLLLGAFAAWVTKLGKEVFLKEIKGQALRGEIKRVRDIGRLSIGMIHTKADPYWPDCFTIMSCRNPVFAGQIVGDLARLMQADPLDVLFDILLEDPETMWAQTVDKRLISVVVPVFLQHPLGMPCTDVMALPLDLAGASAGQLTGSPYGMPPGIAYGLYPHLLGEYVREKRALRLEHTIRSATYLPAQLLGLKDRGVLRPGAYADVVLFDIRTIRMVGDQQNPAQRPEGIRCVLVNGQIVYDGQAHTGAKPGKVLRRT